MKKKKKKKLIGGEPRLGLLALQRELKIAERHFIHAELSLLLAIDIAKELGATDELAVMASALRSIANSADSDPRSKGIAATALKKAEEAS